METQCQYLTITQCNDLVKLLHKFEELFDGSLGPWKTDPVDFELKEYVTLVCSWPYLVPEIHEEVFKNEAERLFLLGVLEVADDSEW